MTENKLFGGWREQETGIVFGQIPKVTEELIIADHSTCFMLQNNKLKNLNPLSAKVAKLQQDIRRLHETDCSS